MRRPIVKRIGGWIFTTTSLCGILVFIATAGMWAFGPQRAYRTHWFTSHTSITVGWELGLEVDWETAADGERTHYFGIGDDQGAELLRQVTPAEYATAEKKTENSRIYPGVRFTWDHKQFPMSHLGGPYGGPFLMVLDFGMVRSLLISRWLLLLASFPLPTFWIIRRLRRRPLAGFCKVCGYDLRASRDRCSECGTPMEGKTALSGNGRS
jgi:hypothetical protein